MSHWTFGQPQMFLKLRSELASLWMPSSKAGNFRKISARADLPPFGKASSTCCHNMPVTMIDEATNMKASTSNGGQNFIKCICLKEKIWNICVKCNFMNLSSISVSGVGVSQTFRDLGYIHLVVLNEIQINIVFAFQELLEAVVPFDILVDRRKRTNYLSNLQRSIDTCVQPKAVQNARNALASLVACEEAIEQELIISASYVCIFLFSLFIRVCVCSAAHIWPLCFPTYACSYVPGMEVTLSSRLKSLYSIYSKVRMELSQFQHHISMARSLINYCPIVCNFKLSIVIALENSPWNSNQGIYSGRISPIFNFFFIQEILHLISTTVSGEASLSQTIYQMLKYYGTFLQVVGLKGIELQFWLALLCFSLYLISASYEVISSWRLALEHNNRFSFSVFLCIIWRNKILRNKRV